MFNFGWTELLLIAVVAIVVIGPKELPEALRSLGRMLTKVRRMAGEFQGQFNEALREANLDEVKKEFDAIRQSTSGLKGGFNPIDIARNEIKGAITGPDPVAASTAGAADHPLMLPSATTSFVSPSLAQGAEDSEADAPAAPPVVIPSAFAPLALFKQPQA